MSIAATAAPLLGEPLPVELMNTIWADREGVHDALATPDAMTAWVAAVAGRTEVGEGGLHPWLEAASQPELTSLHRDLGALRDAARRLAARRTGDARESALMPLSPESALATVNALAASAPTWPVLEWPEPGSPDAGRTSRAPAGEVLVADLAGGVITLLGGKAGETLRACQAPGCVLYFVKQHPRREWCSDSCGNRARQARHYRRHHG